MVHLHVDGPSEAVPLHGVQPVVALLVAEDPGADLVGGRVVRVHLELQPSEAVDVGPVATVVVLAERSLGASGAREVTGGLGAGVLSAVVVGEGGVRTGMGRHMGERSVQGDHRALLEHDRLLDERVRLGLEGPQGALVGDRRTLRDLWLQCVDFRPPCLGRSTALGRLET